MDEILRELAVRSFVLDLGAQHGSFSTDRTNALPVRVDMDVSALKGELAVRADAARLPFREGCFAGVVANHSLEHFDDARGALKEIGRVIQRSGSLFVSVPDASTFTDKLYRWLAQGGGHVNAFTSPVDLAHLIEKETGLKHVATRTLCSSLSFLNERHAPRRRPRRLMLLGGGAEWSLFLYVWLSRRVDRLFGSRLSVYGWGMYFGQISCSVDTTIQANVCIRCGSGSSYAALMKDGFVNLKRARSMRTYRCPNCGAVNPLIDDAAPEKENSL